MHTKTLKARLARIAAALALASLVAAAFMTGGNPAGADPKQYDKPLVAMGSDTTQDILDAFTGEVNGRRFHPLRSSAASGQQQIASWRAVQLDGSGNPVQCVEPDGGILVDRPNGSGNGRRALTAAFTGVGWGRTDVGCTNTYDNMGGLIDFSRSSSGASGTTGDLTFVPFARDALQFAYTAPDAATAVSSLTTGQVQGLHKDSSGNSAVINDAGGTRIIACRIQDGSGTYESWNGFMTVTDIGVLATSTSECARAFDETQAGINGIQEHDPQGLYDACERIRNGYTDLDGASVAAQPNTQCIIGYSAANWIAQFNGVGSRSLDVDGAGTDAPPAASTGGAFNIGTRSDASVPGAAYDITDGVASPNSAYYGAAGDFGRDVYNVIPTGVINASGFLSLKTMLLGDGPDTGTAPDFDSEGPGSGPAICSTEAVGTRNLLGFGAPVDNACGEYGAFNKRAYDFGSTGPLGGPEA